MKVSSFASCTLSSANLLLALTTAIAAESGSNPPPAKPPPAAVEDARVQPRGKEFMPNSADDQAIQRRLTIFNEQQGLENTALDKKLKICRGC
jgi:hypothetical protein